MTDHIVDSNKKVPPCPVCGKSLGAHRFPGFTKGYEECERGCGHIRYYHRVEDWTQQCDRKLGRACRELGIETVEQLKARLAPDPRVAVLDAKVKRLLNGIDQHETHKYFVFGVTQHMGKSEPSAADKDLWALKSAESEGGVV